MKKILVLLAIVGWLALPSFAANSNFRRRQILYSNNSQPQYAVGYTVTVYPVGAIATAASSGTTITVATGHGFAIDDKLVVGLDTTTYRTVTATGATSLTISSAVTVAANDPIVNLKADTGVASPSYDGSTIVIYKYPDLTTSWSSSMVTVGSTGWYEYYTTAGVPVWELVRNTNGGLNEIFQYAIGASVTAGAGNVSSQVGTTAQGIPYFTDTVGTSILSSLTTITAAGSIAVPAGQSITVSPSTTTVNLLQFSYNEDSQASSTCTGAGAAGTGTFMDGNSAAGDAPVFCDAGNPGIMAFGGLDIRTNDTSGNYLRLLNEAPAASATIAYIPQDFYSVGFAWVPITLGSSAAIATVAGVQTAVSLVGTEATGQTMTITGAMLTSGGVGRTMVIEANGVYTTGAGPGNTTYAIKIGTTVVATTGAVALYPASATDRGWDLRAVCVWTSVSTLATAGIICEGTVQAASAAAASVTSTTAFMVNTSAVTVDMSANRLVDLVLTESAAGSTTKGVYARLSVIR